MKLKVESLGGKEIELNMYEQSQVYYSYRKTCMSDAVDDYMAESEEYASAKFINEHSKGDMINCMIDCMDSYHLSEEEAITSVLEDDELASRYIIKCE